MQHRRLNCKLISLKEFRMIAKILHVGRIGATLRPLKEIFLTCALRINIPFSAM